MFKMEKFLYHDCTSSNDAVQFKKQQLPIDSKPSISDAFYMVTNIITRDIFELLDCNEL